MFNFYLANIGYENATISEIEESFIILNDIINKKEEYEKFLMNDSLYELPTIEGNFWDIIYSKFSDKQFIQITLPKLLNSIKSVDDIFSNLEQMDSHINFQNMHNSFYGAKFTIENERHIDSCEKYYKFLDDKKWDINYKTLWERRELLFEKIVLCPDVESHLKNTISHFSQIKQTLKELERYCKENWTIGSFSYQDARKKGLDISPESDSTMKQEKFKNARKFKLPDGRTECFELHLKLGDVRIHIFPDNLKIYVGYIGTHLSTVRHK